MQKQMEDIWERGRAVPPNAAASGRVKIGEDSCVMSCHEAFSELRKSKIYPHCFHVKVRAWE